MTFERVCPWGLVQSTFEEHARSMDERSSAWTPTHKGGYGRRDAVGVLFWGAARMRRVCGRCGWM